MSTLSWGSKICSNQSTILLQLLMIMLITIPSKQQEQHSLAKHSKHNYCRSLTNCQDCVRSVYKCEWCHNIGCTNHARAHCPKKVFLEKRWRKVSNARLCSEVITKSPLFVPENVKSIIKVDLIVGDLTLYEQSIICELHLEGQVYRLFGTLDRSAVYCDGPVLSIKSNVAVGYLKLVWGGAETSSNVILVIVYSCRRLANTCMDCRNLNTELNCGWCKDTISCSLKEECPSKILPWVTRNWTCEGKNREISLNLIVSKKLFHDYDLI